MHNTMKQYEGITDYSVGEVIVFTANYYAYLPPYLGKVLKPFDRSTILAYINRGIEEGITCSHDECDDNVSNALLEMARDGYLELSTYRAIQLMEKEPDKDASILYDTGVNFTNFEIMKGYGPFPDQLRQFETLTAKIFGKVVGLLGDKVAQDVYGQLWAFSQLLSKAGTGTSRETLGVIWESMDYYAGGHHKRDVGGLAIHALGKAQNAVAAATSLEEAIPEMVEVFWELKALEVTTDEELQSKLVTPEFSTGTIPTRGSMG